MPEDSTPIATKISDSCLAGFVAAIGNGTFSRRTEISELVLLRIELALFAEMCLLEKMMESS